MMAYSNKLKRGRLIQWSLFLVKLIEGNIWQTMEQVEIRSCTLHMNDIDYIRYCCYLFRNELRGLCKKDLCDVQAPWMSKLWCLPNDVIPLGYLYQTHWRCWTVPGSSLIELEASFRTLTFSPSLFILVSLGEIYCRFCFTLSCVNPSNGNVDDWEIKEEDK